MNIWEMKMITKLGKVLRKARVDSEMTLGDMADAVGISPAFLSAIENGKKDIKEPLVEKLANLLKLSDEKLVEFQMIAMASNSEVRVNLEKHGEKQIEAVTLLARHIADLSEDSLEDISKIINKEINMSRKA